MDFGNTFLYDYFDEYEESKLLPSYSHTLQFWKKVIMRLDIKPFLLYERKTGVWLLLGGKALEPEWKVVMIACPGQNLRAVYGSY